MTTGYGEKKRKGEYSETEHMHGHTVDVGGKAKHIKLHDGHQHHMGSRMHAAFTRMEHEPEYSRHKGEPSGCME